ncbi:hypothetical protein [Propioniciclava flava]
MTFPPAHSLPQRPGRTYHGTHRPHARRRPAASRVRRTALGVPPGATRHRRVPGLLRTGRVARSAEISQGLDGRGSSGATRGQCTRNKRHPDGKKPTGETAPQASTMSHVSNSSRPEM